MDLLKQIRKKYNNFMLDTNCIDRLMTDKIEDYIIIEEQPMPIRVRKKVIYVGNLTYDNEIKFFNKWAVIISAMCARIINMELSTERKKELLEKADFSLLANGKWMLEFLWMDKWLKKQLCKLIGSTLLKQQGYYLDNMKNRQLKKWTNCSYRYFKKNVTKETLIQIVWNINLYNFDSQKKSLRMLVEKMDINALVETYIPFWLQNLAGLEGKFQLAQVPSIDSVFKDKLNKKNSKTEVIKPNGRRRKSINKSNPK